MRRRATLAVALVTAMAGAVKAPAADAPVPDEDLPSAAWLDKITWSSSPAVTRLRFVAGRPVEPFAVRASAGTVRVDLTAVGAGEVPARLEVGSPHVLSVVRVPDAARFTLPADVSERFLVRLASDELVHEVVPAEDGFTLFVGSADVVRGGDDAASEPWHAAFLREGGVEEQRPAPEDLLGSNEPLVVQADQVLRAAPSALSHEVGRVAAGEARIADARRGEWIHLASGGWLRETGVVRGAAGSAAAPPGTPGRAPMSWSVVTLGTGLRLDVTELFAADAAVAELAELFASPIRAARLEVVASPESAYGVRLPHKEGRLVITMRDGTEVRSLDPAALPLRPGVAREEALARFEAPEVHAGQAWSTVILLPADVDLARAMGARVDVGGREQRLVLVPGSGEPLQAGSDG